VVVDIDPERGIVEVVSPVACNAAGKVIQQQDAFAVTDG